MCREEDAPKTCIELFGEDVSGEVTSCFLDIWRSAFRPGQALLSLEMRNFTPAVSSKSTSGGSDANLVKAAPDGSDAIRDEQPLLPFKIKAAENLLLKSTVAMIAPLQKSVVAQGKSSCSKPSAKANLDAEWEAVLVKCRAFLKEHGPLLPRFVKLFGEDGTGIPHASHLAVQDDCYRSGSTSPATVLGYLKGAKCLVAWSAAVGYDFDALSEFDVASFLRDQCSRGPSVPSGIYRSCIWCYKGIRVVFAHFCTNCHFAV